MLYSGPCDWLVLPQSQCSILGLVIGWFFRFCFQLRQSSFHWITSDGADSDSIELMTPPKTLIFNFHQVISALTTPTMILTLTQSLVKTTQIARPT